LVPIQRRSTYGIVYHILGATLVTVVSLDDTVLTTYPQELVYVESGDLF
jgi:hypothetical protein